MRKEKNARKSMKKCDREGGEREHRKRNCTGETQKPRTARNNMQERERAQERGKALTDKKQGISMTEGGKGHNREGAQGGKGELHARARDSVHVRQRANA